MFVQQFRAAQDSWQSVQHSLLQSCHQSHQRQGGVGRESAVPFEGGYELGIRAHFGDPGRAAGCGNPSDSEMI